MEVKKPASANGTILRPTAIQKAGLTMSWPNVHTMHRLPAMSRSSGPDVLWGHAVSLVGLCNALLHCRSVMPRTAGCRGRPECAPAYELLHHKSPMAGLRAPQQVTQQRTREVHHGVLCAARAVVRMPLPGSVSRLRCLVLLSVCPLDPSEKCTPSLVDH